MIFLPFWFSLFCDMQGRNRLQSISKVWNNITGTTFHVGPWIYCTLPKYTCMTNRLKMFSFGCYLFHFFLIKKGYCFSFLFRNICYLLLLFVWLLLAVWFPPRWNTNKDLDPLFYIVCLRKSICGPIFF